jgi:CRP-like cAMP-binding protein
MHPDPARLLRVPLFAALSERDRARVSSWLEVEDVDAGKRLAHQGASEYWFFVIDEGTVRVDRGGRTLATLGPGNVFGEMSFHGDGGRNADIVAETAVRVFAMYGARFREMQLSIPDVASGLEELVRARTGVSADD